jgi:hypothetical protein
VFLRESLQTASEFQDRQFQNGKITARFPSLTSSLK